MADTNRGKKLGETLFGGLFSSKGRKTRSRQAQLDAMEADAGLRQANGVPKRKKRKRDMSNY